MNKNIDILIGPAAIGKTTYTNERFPNKDNVSIISRDEIVGRVSKNYGLSYDELYLFPPKNATIGTYISGFENYGRVIESPKLIQHLQPFSYEYINDVNTEIHFAFYNEFQTAIRDSNIKNIIIDRVHMRKEERVVYFKYLRYRQDFRITAVLFNFKDPDTLNVIEQVSNFRRIAMEAKGERYRTVPRHVQENMIKFYEPPTLEEGFDYIMEVDTLPALRQHLSTINLLK